LLADVWFGWRMAKTERQEMIWWLGVAVMVILALALVLDVGFGLRL